MAERLGDKAVGSIVTINVSALETAVMAPQNFIVIHQGLPSSLYDSSCNGTWLLWESATGLPSGALGNIDYANSTAHTYLNETFFSQLESSAQSAIQEVIIPCHGASSGLSTKVFLLSACEITGSVINGAYTDGAQLDYFKSSHAHLTSPWWTRSTGINVVQACYYDYYSTAFDKYEMNTASISESYAYRPAMILSPDTLVDDSGYIGGSGSSTTSIIGNVNIGGVARAISGAHVNIGGVWKEVISSYVNIGGAWKNSQ